MFDIKKVEKEAQEELQEERTRAAKTKIKSALKRIADAETILRNAKEEYQVILRDIA